MEEATLVSPTHEGTCGSEDTTPLVFKLGSTVKWVISFTFRSLCTQRRSSPV